MKLKPEDILARIINHELILEEVRYVNNLSKGIVSTKKDVVALKGSKKSKKNQIQVESSSEEQDGDEEDEDEERESTMKRRCHYSSKNSTNT
jgi:formate dehydrogenase assembly factor FdhD